MHARLKLLGVLAGIAILVCIAWMVLSSGPAPVSVVLSDWILFVRLDDDTPSIRLQTSGVVLSAQRRAPARIPLFPRGTVFDDLTINGRPAKPVKDGGWLWIEMARPGAFTVSATLDAKREHDRGERSVRFVKPAFVRSVVQVDSDEALEVWIPTMTETLVGTVSAGTHGRLIAGLRDHVVVTWREPRAAVTRRGTPTVRSSIAWTVGEGAAAVNMAIDVDIVGGPADRITLLLPSGADRVRLSGAHVRDHSQSGNRLDVFLKGDTIGRTVLDLSFAVPRDGKDLVRCPTIDVVDGRVDSGGWVMVSKDAKGVLLEHDVDGYEAVSGLDIPPAIMGLATGKPQYLYRQTSRTSRFILDHVTAEPFPVVETIADRADLLTVVRSGGEEITRARYQVRNNEKQFLKMDLPADAKIVWAEVENRRVTVARDGKHLLIPLAKSVQTRTGLVPFPVEIIYCRQGTITEKGRLRLIDLPELDAVPVAVVNLTVMVPDQEDLQTYRSTLRQVDRFTAREGAWFLSQNDGAAGPEAMIAEGLARNYYSVGYAAYRGNRLEESEVHLSKVAELAPNSSLAENAAKLIDNIRLGRGELDGKADRVERAKIAKIQQALTADNPQLAAEQEQLIKAGLVQLKAGQEELAAELLQQAQRLEGKLTQRSASRVYQKALGKRYKGKLSKVGEARTLNWKLKDKLKALQSKARQIASSTLGAALTRAARAKQVDVREAQTAAFGDVLTEVEQAPKSQLTKGAYAKQYRKKLKKGYRRASPAGIIRKRTQRLADENRYLGQQVALLEHALKAPAASQGTAAQQKVRAGEIVSMSKQAERVRAKVADIASTARADTSIRGNLYDVEADAKLRRLERWAVGNNDAYAALDPALAQTFTTLRGEIETARKAIRNRREKRQAASQVTLDVGDILGRNAWGNDRALEAFIGANYLPQQVDGQFQYRVEEGRLTISNTAQNPEQLNRVLESLRYNAGQVVTVAGRRMPLPHVSRMGALRPLFSERTGDGRNYAVLDEAQYRTLAEASEAWRASSGQRRQGGSPGRRDVVVGTTNTAAEETFYLASSDTDANGIRIADVEVTLPHDRYLVIDNGDTVSVIKAGETRDWIEQAEPIELDVQTAYRFEIPAVGRPIRFEKVLLGAGESPDVDMAI
jgi:hypothetical protein